MKSIRELLLSTGVEGLKGVLEMFKVLLEEARSVPPAVFFKKKLFWKFWGKFLENHLQQSAYWKLITMLNMSSAADIFWEFPENT